MYNGYNSRSQVHRFSRCTFLAAIAIVATQLTAAAAPTCDMSGYKPADGLTASDQDGVLTLAWQGERGAQLRAQFAVENGHPTVRQLAIHEQDRQWTVLANNLMPEFQVTTGKRRLSTEQARYLKKVHRYTPDVINKRKWDTFWDAPLMVPGPGNREVDLPRKADEITHGTSAFQTSRCAVHTDGDRIAVTFNGLSLGIFSGDLRFTVYRGANLLRQEAIARTEKPGVAYIYKAGLRGFAIDPTTKLMWRDDARGWQKYEFGGAPNINPVNLRARNRTEILDTGKGSLAVFPEPHKFFFARENNINLGYVYYRKDSAGSFSLGVMQPTHSEGYRPWGIADAEWKRRVSTAREEVANFALYNAPAGTLQRMAVYYYLSGAVPKQADRDVLAYTHFDKYKPVSGFKVVTGHYHFDFNEMLRDRDNLDYRPRWVSTLRNIGINIVYQGDFHDDSHPHDPGPVRFKEQQVYFEGSQRVSDKNFLVMPAEEVNSYLGGHWYMMLPRPVYFSHADKRLPDQTLVESNPTYGKVWHLQSADDVLNMINREKGIIWTAHPHTKSSEGYPDAYKTKSFFLTDRFVGASFESLPVDLSQKRLCPIRCFKLEDEISNWTPTPKYMIAESDTYQMEPDDSLYDQLAVNYLKLDRVPLYDQSWAPVVENMREGNFFGTTGEILFHNWAVEGSGAERTYTATIEYTFPLQFAELVWGDGTHVGHKIISLTDTLPFGVKTFHIPFHAAGKKWVRFAVWDSAGNGAWVQPRAVCTENSIQLGSL